MWRPTPQLFREGGFYSIPFRESVLHSAGKWSSRLRFSSATYGNCFGYSRAKSQCIHLPPTHSFSPFQFFVDGVLSNFHVVNHFFVIFAKAQSFFGGGDFSCSHFGAGSALVYSSYLCHFTVFGFCVFFSAFGYVVQLDHSVHLSWITYVIVRSQGDTWVYAYLGACLSFSPCVPASGFEMQYTIFVACIFGFWIEWHLMKYPVLHSPSSPAGHFSQRSQPLKNNFHDLPVIFIVESTAVNIFS